MEATQMRKTFGRTSTYELEQIKYEKMERKVSFKDYEYKTEMKPFLQFYKLLATKPTGTKSDLSKEGRLHLYIPDTIVYNDSGKSYRTNPFWIYSSMEGFVYRTEAFQEHHVIQKLGNQFNLKELVAIQKTVRYLKKSLARVRGK